MQLIPDSAIKALKDAIYLWAFLLWFVMVDVRSPINTLKRMPYSRRRVHGPTAWRRRLLCRYQ